MSTMADFLKKYQKLLRLIHNYGAQSIPRSNAPPERMFVNESHWRRFLAACHRGFEKAQNEIVDTLCETREDSSLDADERNYREVLLRKLIDDIAINLLRDRHTAWRLNLYTEITFTSCEILREALVKANQLNRQSHQTFALLADLTTFAQVTDIIRIDLSQSSPSVSLIEIKTGRVNEMLLSQLKKYEPVKESLAFIDSDDGIRAEHRSQARRMLKQRIRLAQIDEILTTDKGVQPGSGVPLVLSANELGLDSYGPFVNDLCDQARQRGFSSGNVNSCIHLGVGYSRESSEYALQQSRQALMISVQEHATDLPEGLTEVYDEFERLAPKADFLIVDNLLNRNLRTVPTRPFTQWEINDKHMLSLISGEMIVLFAFDIPAFVWLCRKIGLNMNLASRKESAKTSSHVPKWDNRGLKYTLSGIETYVAEGTLSRFLSELQPPLPFMEQLMEANFKFDGLI
jgi:hypothetical protein